MSRMPRYAVLDDYLPTVLHDALFAHALAHEDAVPGATCCSIRSTALLRTSSRPLTTACSPFLPSACTRWHRWSPRPTLRQHALRWTAGCTARA